MKLKTHIPSVLKVDGSLICDDLDKANHFNDIFASVFQVDDGVNLDLPDKTSEYLEKINITVEDIVFALSRQNLNRPKHLTTYLLYS